jgi:hypothetical protein
VARRALAAELVEPVAQAVRVQATLVFHNVVLLREILPV